MTVVASIKATRAISMHDKQEWPVVGWTARLQVGTRKPFESLRISE